MRFLFTVRDVGEREEKPSQFIKAAFPVDRQKRRPVEARDPLGRTDKTRKFIQIDYLRQGEFPLHRSPYEGMLGIDEGELERVLAENPLQTPLDLLAEVLARNGGEPFQRQRRHPMLLDGVDRIR